MCALSRFLPLPLPQGARGQSSLGAALTASRQRFVGTVLGALAGAIVALISGRGSWSLPFTEVFIGIAVALALTILWPNTEEALPAKT